MRKKNSFILVRKVRKDVYSCTKCHDNTTIENMNERADLAEIVKNECKHSEVAKIVDEKKIIETGKDECKLDNSKDLIYNIITRKVKYVQIIIGLPSLIKENRKRKIEIVVSNRY